MASPLRLRLDVVANRHYRGEHHLDAVGLREFSHGLKVAFYLFEYRSGDVADHDHEMEEARWMPLEEATRALTYQGDREMVARALSRSAARDR